jgi:hypothetical protein
MQAIALVTGDEFLVPFNLTIDTNDVLEHIKNLTWNWNHKNYFQKVHFDDDYGIDFAEIIGASGFCYNFNLVDADELVFLNK